MLIKPLPLTDNTEAKQMIDHIPVMQSWLTTPVGMVTIKASSQGITHLTVEDLSLKADMVTQLDIKAINSNHTSELISQANEHLQQAGLQLAEYFQGKRQGFCLPLAPKGTEFQRQVWQALSDMAFGEVCSYGDIANLIGRPKAVRAVGAANGANPIAIVVPCHRVIGKNGKLTGYAYGLEMKQFLLNLEASAS
ncbi:methylated-DNA--[protein]-cysteine S-methyltransferase [Shewanella aestuarii]